MQGQRRHEKGSTSASASIIGFTAVLIACWWRYPSTQTYSHYREIFPQKSFSAFLSYQRSTVSMFLTNKMDWNGEMMGTWAPSCSLFPVPLERREKSSGEERQGVEKVEIRTRNHNFDAVFESLSDTVLQPKWGRQTWANVVSTPSTCFCGHKIGKDMCCLAKESSWLGALSILVSPCQYLLQAWWHQHTHDFILAGYLLYYHLLPEKIFNFWLVF